MSYVKAAETYRRNAILTASPEKIVQMLYDGAIRHLERGRLALQDPARTHSAEVGESLGRALGIISELRAALDHARGGKIATDLDALYEFSIDHVTRANVSRQGHELVAGLADLPVLDLGDDEDAAHPNASFPQARGARAP